MLFVQCCENDIFEYVIVFIIVNIELEDWKSRDVVVMVFGKVKIILRKLFEI